MGAAKQYLITDQDWNLFDFASDMKALTGKNLQFETLPIKGYATIYPGGSAEDINTIDVGSIQSEIKGAFNGKPAPASKEGASGRPGGSARPASKHKAAPS